VAAFAVLALTGCTAGTPAPTEDKTGFFADAAVGGVMAPTEDQMMSIGHGICDDYRNYISVTQEADKLQGDLSIPWDKALALALAAAKNLCPDDAKLN
jgi:hypothetical protein